MATGFEFVTKTGSATVLPDNGGCQWHAGCAVPQHGGFALVGDADRNNVVPCLPGMGNSISRNCQLGAPNFQRIVFNPARLGEKLVKFALCSA